MYYGIFAMILIISLILYLSFHRTSYLFLALFVTSSGAMYLFYDGYAQMIFSAGHAETSSHFIPMLLSVAMVTLLYFVRTLLSTTIENQYIKRMHIALVIVWAVLFFMEPIGGYHIIIRIIIPLILFTLLYLLVVSALSWNRQHSTSRFILIGLISFFLGFLGFRELESVWSYCSHSCHWQ